jgi:hypothetical protein
MPVFPPPPFPFPSASFTATRGIGSFSSRFQEMVNCLQRIPNFIDLYWL